MVSEPSLSKFRPPCYVVHAPVDGLGVPAVVEWVRVTLIEERTDGLLIWIWQFSPQEISFGIELDSSVMFYIISVPSPYMFGLPTLHYPCFS